MIDELQITNPSLWREYQEALHAADSTGKFLRNSGRNDLTAVGDINTYSVFAELFSSMISQRGKNRIYCSTGIATDDSNKAFFGAMVDRNSWSVYMISRTGRRFSRTSTAGTSSAC
jgi:hypothetical protein